MDVASNTQTRPAISNAARARFIARLEQMTARRGGLTPAMQRKRERNRAAMRGARAVWEARKERIRTERENAQRADAVRAIAHAVASVREERKDRLFGAVLGMGIALATTGQIALALSVI